MKEKERVLLKIIEQSKTNPKVFYIENTLTPEQNAALFQKGLKLWIEILEQGTSDRDDNK